MKKDFIKLKLWRKDCCGTEWYVAYINPKYIVDVNGDSDVKARCEYNLNSLFIAKIGKSSQPFRNGTRWFIHSANEGTDKYFECIEPLVAITLDRVKEIMSEVMRKAFQDRHGTWLHQAQGLILKT